MKPQIDFTLLWDKTEGYAVRCRTAEDATVFISCAMELFPEMCRMWRPGETNHDSYSDETIYTFDHKIGGRWTKSNLAYGSVRSARNIGYKIIDFSEIFQEEDINESEMSMDVLFG